MNNNKKVCSLQNIQITDLMKTQGDDEMNNIRAAFLVEIRTISSNDYLVHKL